jgi:tRNA-uridine 2-sulfurtransferase
MFYMGKKVFVGISGGVDSAVSAKLLLEKGYDVTGVFMKNWSSEDYGIENDCPWEEDLKDTVEICKVLGIQHKTYNFEKEYRKYILENFFEEYRRGNTPNPDVLCNKYIKFDCFLKKALEEGADYIATGHYSKTKNGRLFKAKDTNKDQTYFLYRLSKKQLEKSVFPLGDLTKEEVRKLAKNFKLPVAEKKDSQGLCFIGKINIREFLRKTLKEKKGEVIDLDQDKVVGEHNRIWSYTIGQRHGIEIGGTKEPYFVAKKDIHKNILYVVQGRDNPLLYKKNLTITDLHLINPEYKFTKENFTATIRYRSPDRPIKLSFKGNKTKVEFKEAQWAPALGQSVVIFDKNECLGGGFITEIE